MRCGAVGKLGVVFVSPGSTSTFQCVKLNPPITVLDKIEDRGKQVSGQRQVRLLDVIREPSEYFGLFDRR